MIGMKQFFAPAPHEALTRLLQQTHSIHATVAKSLVKQGHQHLLENTRNLEQTLLQPLNRLPDTCAQEKGHQLQAWMHLSRIEKNLEAFDQESRSLAASRPDAHSSLQNITKHNERLASRVEARDALLDRRAAWAAATAPQSSALDPITLPVLPVASLNSKLAKQDLEQAVKHVNALDSEVASLDGYIKQQTQPISREEEDIFIAQRNALTEYRNAWATGRLKGTSQFKTSIGLTPQRKHLEQNLERSKQLAPLELTLHRLDRTLETAKRNGLDDKLSQDAVDAARKALVNLRDAWGSGSLDRSSKNGMNPTWILTSPNKQRIELELAVIQKAFVQLNAVPRTEQAGSAQARQDFTQLIHSSAATHLKQVAINQHKDDNRHRAQVAELNTDLRTIYTELEKHLALSQISKSGQ